MKLRKIGFSPWFEKQLDRSRLTEFQIARITTVNKDNYIIATGKNEIPAEATGKLLFHAETALDIPAVGDWVYVQLFDNDTHAIIHDILPRKTILKRKAAGKKIDFQIIATNIDTAMIVQSLDHNFNIKRLERYLVMINEGNIEPLILLSKADLLPRPEIDAKKEEIRKRMPEIGIVTFSNQDGSGLEELKNRLTPAKTFCLLGSSGVGKTTLLNKLIEKEEFRTTPVREKDSRGRHATTRRQLIRLTNGALIIDTPGMRELGNFDIDNGMEETFDEITRLSAECRFNDCMHTGEAGCAILAAVESGEITKDRFDNYIKLRKETEYLERSYLEKKERDKKFGKMVKSIMKDKKKRG